MRNIVKNISLLFFICMCYSCAQKVMPGAHKHTQRDSIRTEYKYDSIYIDRWHNIYTKGDTVYIHDSIWREKWRVKTLTDSVYINNTDTIYSTIEIEKKSSTFLRNSGIALWVILALLIVSAIIGLIIKIAK